MGTTIGEYVFVYNLVGRDVLFFCWFLGKKFEEILEGVAKGEKSEKEIIMNVEEDDT